MTLKDKLKAMAGRVTALNGGLFGDRIVDGGNKQVSDIVRESVLAVYKDQSDKAAYIELMDRARKGDKEAVTALNELRIEQSQNYLMANANFGMLFRQVTLQPGDRPVFQNSTKQEIRVGYVGQDGRARTVQVPPLTSETLIPLKFLETEDYEYPLTDIYQGDITGVANATVDIAEDLGNQIEKIQFDLLNASLVNGGAFGAFTLTGAKPTRVYVPNSRINTANLPTSNDITLTGNTTTTKFRLAAVRAAMKYTSQFGTAFRGGPLRATGRIIVPALDASDLSEEIVPTGSTNNPVADEVMNSFDSFDYMKTRWVIVPDNTLEPGVCYFQLNRPVGTIFYKPSLDEEFVETNRKKNKESRSQRKVVGVYINSHDRVNALRVRYRTAA